MCGATLAFLRSNYHPAKIFMGDCGALALGFLLAAIAVQGVLKTAATIALVGPLLVLAVPILDTSFVVLKRLKYQPRRRGAPTTTTSTTGSCASASRSGAPPPTCTCGRCCWPAYAILLRFVPPRPRGDWDTSARAASPPWRGLVVIGASIWMVYTLEILKERHLQASASRRFVPGADAEREVSRRDDGRRTAEAIARSRRALARRPGSASVQQVARGRA